MGPFPPFLNCTGLADISTRILAYDIKSSSVLLAAPSRGNGQAPRLTLLVDLSVPLLGSSPAAHDVSAAYGSVAPQARIPNTIRPAAAYDYRSRVKLERGEWISVVGWLGTEEDRNLSKVRWVDLTRLII